MATTYKLIDTHAHLDSPIYEQDIGGVLDRAVQDDIAIVTVGNDYESSVRAVEIAERHPNVFAAVGLHPRHVRTDVESDDRLLSIDRFRELAEHPKVVAIGEAGLDYIDLPMDVRTDPKLHRAERIKENQKKVFGRLLQLSREARLPMLLHCREAQSEMLEMLDTWDKATTGFDSRGVVHAFTGTWKEAKKWFNLGFLISFTGIVTYGGYRSDVMKKAPLNRIVLESDCPYHTPAAWSIRRNEPSYLRTVADAVAGIRGISSEEVAHATSGNALSVFRKMAR